MYKATVVDGNNNTETYTGLTKNYFKDRYHAHSSSFRKRKKRTRNHTVYPHMETERPRLEF